MRGRHAILSFGGRQEFGFPQKVFWQATGPIPGTLRLRGTNLKTGRPMLFGTGYTPRAHRVGYVSDTIVYVPAAGCYRLTVRWQGGGWTLPFAAGRGSIT